jgi:hypothetical protein
MTPPGSLVTEHSLSKSLLRDLDARIRDHNKVGVAIDILDRVRTQASHRHRQGTDKR